jgi:hypothetical protein
VVEQAGAIAGFAAIIGLAVLSALYFSQARDLRRLREWAGRAPERAAAPQPGQAPGRVTAVPQQQQQQRPPQAGPAPAAAAAGGAAAGAAAAKPATPAGAQAPNGTQVAEQTKPDETKPDEAQETAAGSNGDAAPAVAAAPGKDAEQAEGEAEKKGEDGEQAAKPGMPAPASAAAAAAGAGAGAKSVAGPAAPANPASAPKPGAQPQRPPGSVLPPRTGTLPPVRRLPSSNVGAGQPGSAPPPPEKKKRNPVYVVLAVAGVLVLGAAAAIGVPALVNGSKNDNSSTAASSKSTSTKTTKKTAPVSPDKITVAVLNGTTIPGLAAQVGDRVDAEGFTLGTVSNASQSTGSRANSVVMYARGHSRDARQVARKLNIHNVQPVDSDSQSIAGDASVIVLVGSDKTQ